MEMDESVEKPFLIRTFFSSLTFSRADLVIERRLIHAFVLFSVQGLAPLQFSLRLYGGFVLIVLL